MLAPILLGCFFIMLQEAKIIGWLLIGIGLLYLVMQLPVLQKQTREQPEIFKRLINSLCLVLLSAYFLYGYIENAQNHKLLLAIGSALTALSLLLEIIIAKRSSGQLSVMETEAKSPVILWSMGVGCALSALVVMFA